MKRHQQSQSQQLSSSSALSPTGMPIFQQSILLPSAIEPTAMDSEKVTLATSNETNHAGEVKMKVSNVLYSLKPIPSARQHCLETTETLRAAEDTKDPKQKKFNAHLGMAKSSEDRGSERNKTPLSAKVSSQSEGRIA